MEGGKRKKAKERTAAASKGKKVKAFLSNQPLKSLIPRWRNTEWGMGTTASVPSSKKLGTLISSVSKEGMRESRRKRRKEN